jgi:hypothetical protein
VKKTLLVAALAVMLLFAVAGSAFAVNKSGQPRGGAAKIAPATIVNLAPGQTNPVAGAGTNTYMDWSLSNGTNNLVSSGVTPHGNYTTTTVKCAVCHAVHYAAPGGATVASNNQVADTLLRMRADQSCIYCHASSSGSVNGRPVYNGLGSALIGDGTDGHKTGANCSFCHTTVHGVGQDTSVASLSGYLLNTMPNTNVQNTGHDTVNMLDAIDTIDKNAHNQGFAYGEALGDLTTTFANDNSAALRERAVGIFCAECHNGAYATVGAGAAANVRGSGSGAVLTAYSGHRIKAPATSNWNGAGDKVSSSALSGIAVAWADANNCKSCHDATDNFNNPAFPHAWGQTPAVATANGVNPNAKMWLTAAADAAAGTKKPVAQGAPSDNTQLSDGVCLKCHVASGAAAGVGITF